MPTKTAEANFTGIFDQAVQSFNDTFRASVKVQEDLAKWWSDALEQSGPAQEWQRRSRAMVNEAIPAAQSNAEEWLKVLDDNYARTMELLKKAFCTNGVSTPAEFQNRVTDLWEQSLAVVKENAQSMAQANTKMMDVWAQLMRKNMNEAVKNAGVAAAL